MQINVLRLSQKQNCVSFVSAKNRIKATLLSKLYKLDLMEYIPARLVKAKDRWYVIYYTQNPVTREFIRERKTFKLNRIKDRRERLRLANSIIQDLNQKLPNGYPWNEIDPNLQLKQTNILVALEYAF